MAFNIDNINTYIEQQKTGLMSATVLSAPSLEMFRLMPNVKGKTTLNLLDQEVTLQDGSSCGFTASGDTTISQRELDPKPLKVNEEWCDKTLMNYFGTWEIKHGVDKQLPFEEYITDEIIMKVGNKLEKLIWQGDTASTDTTLKLMDGIVKILNGESTVLSATGTDIYSTVMAVFNAIDEDVLDRAKIYLSPANFRAYVQALIEKNNFHFTGDMNAKVYVPGTTTEVVKVPGLKGNNKIYSLVPEEVVYGFDKEDDYSTFDLWYSKDARKFRLAIEFLAGVQIAFPQHAVVGTITPAA